jgi:hypothetical protein
MNNKPYYPIGIQDFSEIRSLNAVYVDKTELIYKLVSGSKFVFLSRPRRFGKSLLSSTIQYYFEGRKDLFTGLAMDRLESEWIEHPVLHFDLSTAKGKPLSAMEENISIQLDRFEARYGVTEKASTLGNRLDVLIHEAYDKTKRNVVILIDEYDAPILDVMHDDEKREEVRALLREFYSPLKAYDRLLRFVFITGISMFSQLSIFSELNNLKNISKSNEYATICGITKQELLDNFQYGIAELSQTLNCTETEVVQKLSDRYDGYHFTGRSMGLFNPFSILNAFDELELGSYWFASGTPRALVEMLKRYNERNQFGINDIESNEPVSAEMIESPLEAQIGPIPLLYQAGYLTIKEYNQAENYFTLAIPNAEVRVGLMKNLLPLFSDITSADAFKMSTVADRTSYALNQGDVDRAMQLLQSMLASIPFMKGDKDILADAEKTEAHYHIIFYFFFRMLSNEVYAEVRNARGATDVVIKTPKYIYIVEIKIDSTPDVALQQIEDKGYATPYLTGIRKLIKVGVNFSTSTRTIDNWIIA